MFEETAHVSTCTCSTHHFLRLLSGSTDQGSDMLTLYAFCMIIWVKITGGISAYNLMMMAHFSVTSAPFCSIQTMWVVISRDDCLTHFGGVKITYPYRKDGCISTLSVFDSSTFYMLLGAFYFFYTDSYLFCTRSTTWLCKWGLNDFMVTYNYNYACYTISLLPELYNEEKYHTNTNDQP